MKQAYIFLTFIFAIGMSETTAVASELSGGADIMSRYVWRGRDYGNSMSIQPTLEYSCGNFTIGTWGAFSINNDVYQEHDIYLSYNIADLFTVGVTDYFFPAFPSDDITFNNNYFDFDDETTGHITEANLAFAGTDGFPISIAVNVFFYGADKNEDGDANFSTYIELGYSNKLGDIAYDIFAGFTPNEMSLYAEKAGLVNLGITVTKEVKISETFTLPVMTSFITNPTQENIYFVFGISL